MREASWSTRVSQWWTAVPFVTSAIVLVCGLIYTICLLIGYHSFSQVCFLPSAVTVNYYEVYRAYTSTLFHRSIWHLLFNMLSLVQIGSGLERVLGSVRYSHVLFFIAPCNGVLRVLFALLAAHNPIHPYAGFMNECSFGFSGMIFAMIVMETSLSGAQSCSIFGIFDVPAKWYAWSLLILCQLLMPHVSFLVHLCGILSGFAYTYGLFNPLLLGPSTYSAVENLLASCARWSRTVASPSWRALRSWADKTFPGRGRTLAAGATTKNRPTSGGERTLDAGATTLGRVRTLGAGATTTNGPQRGRTLDAGATTTNRPQRGRTLDAGATPSGRGRTLGAGATTTDGPQRGTLGAGATTTNGQQRRRTLDAEATTSGRGKTLGAGATTTSDEIEQMRALVLQMMGALTTNRPQRGRTLGAGATTTNRPDETEQMRALVLQMMRALRRTKRTISSLIAMGFKQEKVAVGLDVANGDLAMAVEILSSQVP